MISAEVVGSNPTRSIFSYYRTTALFLSLFSVIVGQKPLLAMPWIKATVKSLMRGCLRFLDFTSLSLLSLICCTACKTLSYTDVNFVVLLRRAEQMHFTS